MATKYTAFDLMLAMAQRAQQYAKGTATGGTTTTIIDTNLLGEYAFLNDNDLAPGTAFIVTTTDGNAPQSESRLIKTYDESANTANTIAFSVAVGAGDTYVVCPIRRDLFFMALNSALEDLGPLPYTDDTSLDTAANTLRYTLPTNARRDLRQVWVANHASSPYDWEENREWYVVPEDTTLNLVFRRQPRYARDIRLVYTSEHPYVDDDADEIHDLAPREYLIWRGVFHIFNQQMQSPGVERSLNTGLMNQAAEYAANALEKYPVPQPHYSIIFSSYPDADVYRPQYPIQTEEIPTS
jgi:hypothetical protein